MVSSRSRWLKEEKDQQWTLVVEASEEEVEDVAVSVTVVVLEIVEEDEVEEQEERGEQIGSAHCATTLISQEEQLVIAVKHPNHGIQTLMTAVAVVAVVIKAEVATVEEIVETGIAEETGTEEETEIAEEIEMTREVMEEEAEEVESDGKNIATARETIATGSQGSGVIAIAKEIEAKKDSTEESGLTNEGDRIYLLSFLSSFLFFIFLPMYYIRPKQPSPTWDQKNTIPISGLLSSTDHYKTYFCLEGVSKKLTGYIAPRCLFWVEVYL